MNQARDEKPIIRLKRVTYRYPAGTVALRDVSLDIERGEFVALIGQNGAGKTTMTKHLNALLHPTQGEVWVDGAITKQLRTAKLARKVGYLFQNPDNQIFCDSVWEEVAFGPKRLGLRGEELNGVVAQALERLQLTDLKDEHPYVLSKGHRQQVAFASVVAMGPKILVIDEPTTGQDWKQSQMIMGLLRELHKEGRTILFVTHDMRFVAECAERTVVMGQGEILLDDTTRNVFRHVEALRSTHLLPPQITNLGWMLGLPDPVLSTDEMKEVLGSRPDPGG